ncbi:MAG: C25 family cysteine peptidase [Planctomycetota bacterium]
MHSLLLTVALALQPPGEDPALLVVVPRALRAELGAFVAFKRTQMSVEVAVLEDLLAIQPGVDDPERIKHFLFERWHAGVRYVLLVGDVGVMPTRFMTLDRCTPEAFDQAFYPSDLYYADLARRDGSFEDWNAAHEGYHAGYFGEVQGEKHKDGVIDFDRVDYLPEIAVGRWPVRNAAELARIARKSVLAEKERLAETGLPRTLMLHCDGWVDMRGRMDAMATRLDGQSEVIKLYDGTAEPPRDAAVAARIRTGVDLILHSGHGDPGGLHASLRDHTLLKIDEPPCLPVILSIGCSTAVIGPQPPYEAYLDVDGVTHRGTNSGEVFTAPPPPPATLQPTAFDQTSTAERSLRECDGGAVAWIGCDTGAQPCAFTLMEGFTDALARPGPRRLGECWAFAVSAYYEREHLAELKPNADWYPPSIFFQGMKFVLLGDPTLHLRAR